MNAKLNQTGAPDLQHDRLEHFPVSFFSIVMGLSGLTVAWQSAGKSIVPQAGWWLGVMTSVVMLVITLIYSAKILLRTHAVLHELRHPIRLNFFPAFSISLLLLSVVWRDYPQASLILWGGGTAIQFTLTLYVMSSWINHSHYTLAHANPSWFIPVVGNIIIPISGAHFGYMELGWFFFSIGIVFWIVLLTIVLYRLFFHDPLPPKFMPMLFILLAPPSVGFVSYTALQGDIDAFARILYYIALFLGILLLANVFRFSKVPFFISSWAYSFPFAALTIATAKKAHMTAELNFSIVAKSLLIALSMLMLWLIVHTIKSIKKRGICLPE